MHTQHQSLAFCASQALPTCNKKSDGTGPENQATWYIRHYIIHSKNKNVVVTKSMLFQLNVGHSNATVS